MSRKLMLQATDPAFTEVKPQAPVMRNWSGLIEDRNQAMQQVHYAIHQLMNVNYVSVSVPTAAPARVMKHSYEMAAEFASGFLHYGDSAALAFAGRFKIGSAKLDSMTVNAKRGLPMLADFSTHFNNRDVILPDLMERVQEESSFQPVSAHSLKLLDHIQLIRSNAAYTLVCLSQMHHYLNYDFQAAETNEHIPYLTPGGFYFMAVNLGIAMKDVT